MTEYDHVRKVMRYGLVVDIELTDLASKILLKGSTTDISVSGCRIGGLSDFPHGTKVRVKLIREGAEIEGYGKIVYARPDFGTGIAFTVIEPKDEVVLAVWIEEIARRRDLQH